MGRPARGDDGFTLVEVILILLVIAVLAIFATQRIGGVTQQKALAFRKKLQVDIRYAQNVAMTQRRRTRVYLNGTGSAPVAGYAIVGDGSAGGTCGSFPAVSDPAGGGALTVTLGTADYAGITITPAGSSCLEFDSLGSPYDCSANLGICSTTPAGATITVKADGAAVGAVTIAAMTGAVN